MILSDDHRFAFVHIPKCAGTSLKQKLESIDSYNQKFNKIGHHPVLGTVNYSHFTLSDLQIYFPTEFEKVEKYDAVAILRDPMDRFFSAIFQRLRDYKRYAQSDINKDIIERESNEVIEYLDVSTERLDVKYIHFSKQCDFIELEGKRIANAIFPIERMDKISAYIKAATGIEIGEERQNRSVELSIKSLRPLQRALRTPYSRVFPAKFRADIRRTMVRAGFYKDISKEQFIRSGSSVERFIRDYYARDFAIYEESLAAGEHGGVRNAGGISVRVRQRS